MPQTHVALPGSRRPARAGAKRIADVPADSPIEVTVAIRGPKLPDDDALGQPALSREQFRHHYAASQHDADQVAANLQAYGLKIDETSLINRTLRVSGTAAQMEAAFQAQLGIYHDAQQGNFRGRASILKVPTALGGIVQGVFGLDERRVALRHTQFRELEHLQAAPLTPKQVAQRYAFPQGDGKGQVIGIAEFGGAYFPADAKAFNEKYQLPLPTITPVSVGLPVLTPSQVQKLRPARRKQVIEDSGEVMMDIEIVASLCPAATILVFFAPFTQKGWVDLIGKLVAGTPQPCSILSVSWGLAEDSPDWTESARTAIDTALKSAALQGITVCVAAGDDGSGDQEQDNRAHVNFPASSPSVLSVGGTMLSGADEVVWWNAPGDRSGGGGATGGGVSVLFQRSAWQDVTVASLNAGSIDGRVIPDIAAVAGDPFYDLIFQNHDAPAGGTSASTPVWAALLARVHAALPAGTQPQFLTPQLYRKAADGKAMGARVCTDITTGNNTSSPNPGRGYEAANGYDAVSGWGVPIGTALLQALAEPAV
jgi:kumamolisin